MDDNKVTSAMGNPAANQVESTKCSSFALCMFFFWLCAEWLQVGTMLLADWVFRALYLAPGLLELKHRDIQ
jgi:hypothetical protein